MRLRDIDPRLIDALGFGFANRLELPVRKVTINSLDNVYIHLDSERYVGFWVYANEYDPDVLFQRLLAAGVPIENH